MALTSDGRLLFGANNAEDPPFGTLFRANGDAATDHSQKLIRVTVDATIMPPGFGLSIEQPAWDPKTRRFITSLPIIADNPPGCNYGQLPTPASPGPITAFFARFPNVPAAGRMNAHGSNQSDGVPSFVPAAIPWQPAVVPLVRIFAPGARLGL